MSLQYRRIMSSYKKGWWLAGDINPYKCLGAYQAIGISSYEASIKNLAHPGHYTLTENDPISGWSNTTGWQFDGTDDTGLSTGIILEDVNHSMIVRFSDGLTDSQIDILIGSSDGTYIQLVRQTNPNQKRGYRNGTSLLQSAASVASGVLGYAGNTGYYNGVTDGTITGLDGVNARNIVIGGLCVGPANIDNVFQGNIQAVAIYKTVLTDAQVAAVSHAMARL